jgi:hypothetical protein
VGEKRTTEEKEVDDDCAACRQRAELLGGKEVTTVSIIVI